MIFGNFEKKIKGDFSVLVHLLIMTKPSENIPSCQVDDIGSAYDILPPAELERWARVADIICMYTNLDTTRLSGPDRIKWITPLYR